MSVVKWIITRLYTRHGRGVENINHFARLIVKTHHTRMILWLWSPHTNDGGEFSNQSRDNTRTWLSWGDGDMRDVTEPCYYLYISEKRMSCRNVFANTEILSQFQAPGILLQQLLQRRIATDGSLCISSIYFFSNYVLLRTGTSWHRISCLEEHHRCCYDILFLARVKTTKQ